MKIGIIGMGGMGSLYLDTFSGIDGANVTALVSGSYPFPEAQKRGIKLYTDYVEMLDNECPDICCVCTPTFLHFEQVKAALTRAVHTICEKPLAFTADEARELYSLAKAKGVFLFPAQVVRFAASTKKLKEIINSRAYGKIQDAFFFRISKTPLWTKDTWVFDPKKSGLVTYDMHIHDLDLVIYLFGKPLAAEAFDKPANLPLDIDFRRYRYSFEGFDAFAEAAWYNADIPFKAGFRVVFEDAVAECENDIFNIHTKDGRHFSCSPNSENASETGINVPKTDMYQTELSHFIDCIRKGSDSDVVKQEDIIVLHEILESMRMSYR